VQANWIFNGHRTGSNSMSYQHHWVVVYDEDWKAFMVDAEGEVLDRDKMLYNKQSGKWEYLEEDSDQETEYYRLEEILAYNLTRLDLTAEIG
jgi:stress response protein SCP2